MQPKNKPRFDEAEMARLLMELKTRFIWGTNAIADVVEMDSLLDAFIARCKKDYSLMTDTIVCFGRGNN
jgi:hypothetical protein